MEYIIAKIYEMLIRHKNKKYCQITMFEYTVLTGRGFTEYHIAPNTMNRVTIYYNRGWGEEYHKTFNSIREAYKKF